MAPLPLMLVPHPPKASRRKEKGAAVASRAARVMASTMDEFARISAALEEEEARERARRRDEQTLVVGGAEPAPPTTAEQGTDAERDARARTAALPAAAGAATPKRPATDMPASLKVGRKSRRGPTARRTKQVRIRVPNSTQMRPANSTQMRPASPRMPLRDFDEKINDMREQVKLAFQDKLPPITIANGASQTSRPPTGLLISPTRTPRTPRSPGTAQSQLSPTKGSRPSTRGGVTKPPRRQQATSSAQTVLNYSAAAKSHAAEAPNKNPPERSVAGVFGGPGSLSTEVAASGKETRSYGRRLHERRIGALASKAVEASRIKLASQVVRAHDSLASNIITTMSFPDDGLGGASARVVADGQPPAVVASTAAAATATIAKLPSIAKSSNSVGVQAAPTGYTRFFFSDLAIDRAIAPVLASSGISPGVDSLRPEARELVGGRSNQPGVAAGPWFYMHFDVRMCAPDELIWLPVVPGRAVHDTADDVPNRPVMNDAVADIPEWAQELYDRLHFASLEMHAGETVMAGGWPEAPLSARSQAVDKLGGYLCCADDSAEQRMPLVKLTRYASMIMPRGREDALALIRLLGGLLTVFIAALEKADAVALAMREEEKAKVARLMAENVNLKANLAYYKNAYEDLKANYDADLQALRDAHAAELAAERAKWDAERAALVAERDSARKLAESLRSQLDTALSQLQDEREHRALLQGLLEQERLEKKRLMKELRQANEKIKEMEDAMERIMRNLAAALDQMNQLKRRVNDLEGRIAELEGELETAYTRIHGLEAESARFREQLQNSEAMKWRLAMLEAMLEELRAELAANRLLKEELDWINDGLAGRTPREPEGAPEGAPEREPAPPPPVELPHGIEQVTDVQDEAAYVRDLFTAKEVGTTNKQFNVVTEVTQQALERLQRWASTYLPHHHADLVVYLRDSLVDQNLARDAENEKKGAKGKKKGKAQTDDQSIASFNHSGPNDRSAIKVTAKGVKIYGGIGKMAIACISLVHEMGHLASARNTPPKVYTSYEDADFELSWEGAPDGAQTIEICVPVMTADTSDTKGQISSGVVYARLTRPDKPKERPNPPCRILLPGPREPYEPLIVTERESVDRLVISLKMLATVFGQGIDDLNRNMLSDFQRRALMFEDDGGRKLSRSELFTSKIEEAALMRGNLNNMLNQFAMSPKMNLMLEELRSYKKGTITAIRLITALFLLLDPLGKSLWERLMKRKNDDGMDVHIIPELVSSDVPGAKTRDNLYAELRDQMKDLGGHPAKELAHRISILKLPSEFEKPNQQARAYAAIRSSEAMIGSITQKESSYASEALVVILQFLTLIFQLHKVLEELQQVRQAALDEGASPMELDMLEKRAREEVGQAALEDSPTSSTKNPKVSKEEFHDGVEGIVGNDKVSSEGCLKRKKKKKKKKGA